MNENGILFNEQYFSRRDNTGNWKTKTQNGSSLDKIPLKQTPVTLLLSIYVSLDFLLLIFKQQKGIILTFQNFYNEYTCMVFNKMESYKIQEYLGEKLVCYY